MVSKGLELPEECLSQTKVSNGSLVTRYTSFSRLVQVIECVYVLIEFLDYFLCCILVE